MIVIEIGAYLVLQGCILVHQRIGLFFCRNFGYFFLLITAKEEKQDAFPPVAGELETFFSFSL